MGRVGRLDNVGHGCVGGRDSSAIMIVSELELSQEGFSFTSNAPSESETSNKVSSHVSAPKVLSPCQKALKDSRLSLSWKGLRTASCIRAIVDGMLWEW